MKKPGLLEIMAHATLILAAMCLTLVIIDRFNPAMEFIGSDISDYLLLLFCACALVFSICAAVALYRRRSRGDDKKDENP